MSVVHSLGMQLNGDCVGAKLAESPQRWLAIHYSLLEQIQVVHHCDTTK